MVIRIQDLTENDDNLLSIHIRRTPALITPSSYSFPDLYTFASSSWYLLIRIFRRRVSYYLKLNWCGIGRLSRLGDAWINIGSMDRFGTRWVGVVHGPRQEVGAVGITVDGADLRAVMGVVARLFAVYFHRRTV